MHSKSENVISHAVWLRRPLVEPEQHRVVKHKAERVQSFSLCKGLTGEGGMEQNARATSLEVEEQTGFVPGRCCSPPQLREHRALGGTGSVPG